MAVATVGLSLFLAACGNSAGKTEANPKGGAGGGGAPGGAAGAGGRRGAGGDVPVTVAKVTTREVPVDIQVIGNVEAYSTINVKAQVGGELTKVYFQEGDFVKAGDTLFEIDRRQLQAQLAQMQATFAKNQAQLKQAQANLAKDIAQAQYAKSQAGRYADLTKEGVISKEQNDQVATAADAAAQSVEADRAAIESARADISATQANVDNIKVMMGYTTIKSPITGRTGNLAVKQGNVVNANTMDLIGINQVQPIYATFAVPEIHLPEIKTRMAQAKLQVFAAPQDTNAPPDQGVLTFIDNNVDTSTGTIKLKATFPNANRSLWPGQFVRVTIRLRTESNALVVPNQAVQTGQAGTYVYVVKDDKSVESRPVTTMVRVDQDMVISKGLDPGETVVVDGQLRLAPGMKVSVREPGGSGGAGGGGRRAGGQGAPGGGGDQAAAPAPQGDGAAGKGAEGKGGRRKTAPGWQAGQSGGDRRQRQQSQ